MSKQLPDRITAESLNKIDQNGLSLCIDRIHKGAWKFIQLRGTSLSSDDIDRGDVDLLGTETSIRLLLDAVFQWCIEGLCHVRVSSRKPRKRALYLYSRDGRHCLHFDLWRSIPQLVDTPHSLIYEDLSSIASGKSIQRLESDIEACIYIHHLVSKKKKLSSPSVTQRLQGYITLCQNSQSITKHLKEIKQSKTISKSTLNESLDYLKSKTSGFREKKSFSAFPFHLKGSSKGHILTIMGCDGVGKTTLSETIASCFEPSANLYKGKHLYRKCWLFKASVICIRPLLFQSREKFDESLAPFVYLRACLGLFIKRITTKKNLIIDRSLADFIFLSRKTDLPHWSKFKWLSSLFGVRLPIIHCIANFDTISKRKLEITEKGHAIYDKSMFQHFSYRVPSEYMLFNNSDNLKKSKEVMVRLISRDNFPLSFREKVR